MALYRINIPLNNLTLLYSVNIYTFCLFPWTTGKDVVSAGKDNSPRSSPELLQPVSTNGGSFLRHSQPPLLSHGSTPGPMAACTEKSSSSSQSSSGTSQRVVEQCTHIPTHPAGNSSGTSPTGQFVSDHRDTGRLSWHAVPANANSSSCSQFTAWWDRLSIFG